ncbi:P-loop containing protein [Fusarium sp. NRRL 52700]|nr:P-loop containing protein [Fusarium sp. NRRL 52700]
MASAHPEVRPALSQLGRGPLATLGSLYDARSEEVLMRSILKTTTLPPESVVSSDGPGLKYKHTTTDSLEEKFSNLDISAELGVSILCGMLGGGGLCVEYLSKKKMSARIRQASTICITPTKTEILRLENDDLKNCLDLGALHTRGATHVICGIEWGARTLVTVKESTTSVDANHKIKGKLGNKPSEPGENPGENGKAVSPTPPVNGATLSRLAKFIGEIHVNGTAEWDSKLSSMATALDFEIAADVANVAEGGIPANIEGVKDFLRSIPSSLQGVNGGKGVPISFYLLPITEVAEMFKIEIRHDTIVKRLEQDGLDGSVDLLEELETTTRDLGDYVALLEQHSFCVPRDYIEEAQKQLRLAKRKEQDFKRSLATAITEIRRGSEGMDSLFQLLGDFSSSKPDVESHRSFLNKYVDKMSFADTVKNAGGEYISHDMLNSAIISSKTADMYIFYCNGAVQDSSGWSDERQTLIDLLNGRADECQILVVDYDVPVPKALEKTYIEQRRGGQVIVPDVTQDWKDLAQLCQLKCSVNGRADRTRSVAPPSCRRVVRIPCPGESCFGTGKLKWNCPTCQDPVCYGFTDDYLYCLCSRYHFTDGVFKCNRPIHGAKFVKYGGEDLHQRLKSLDPSEEYNILVLGKSGVGKSMLINTLVNYLEFESLHDAITDPGPLRYIIPCSFSYQDEELNDHQVVVGKETFWEKLSKIGHSSTKKTLTYCFNMDGKTIRFIDTPGMNDTEGIDQDHENVKDILRMLESIDKLSAILILMHPNETRLDAPFKFCIKELLSRLHRDTSKNLLFGFTNSIGTHFTLGATQGPLDHMLEELRTGVARGETNQYFFDSKGFMFLAAYKQNLPYMRGGMKDHSVAWRKSASELHRLITTVMRLPTHDMDMTLKLNRTRTFLDGMAKPLAKFITSTKTEQEKLEDAERELAEVIAQGGDLAEMAAKTKIEIVVPVRHDLSHPRTVCAHPSCTSQVKDEEGVLQTVFKTICHSNCNIVMPDEIKGADELINCSPFRRWWPSIKLVGGYECVHDNCKHDWNEHMHISYEFRNETRIIDDNQILDKIRSNADEKEKLDRKVQAAQKLQQIMRKERGQIQAARALFFVYLSHNAVGKSGGYIDATIKYLDLQITVANQDLKTEKAAELELQRSVHINEVMVLEEAITKGTVAVPNERAVDETIAGLKSMSLFGKNLSDAVKPRNVEFEGSRFIFIPSKPKSRIRAWFCWD